MKLVKKKRTKKAEKKTKKKNSTPMIDIIIFIAINQEQY